MHTRPALSLAEFLIAAVILGLLAALTIPRFSRAADPPDGAAALRDDLRVLRVAIERYYLDHDVFPGRYGDGANSAGTEAAFVAQLTMYTDAQGRVSDASSPEFQFGPYLRDGVPPACIPPGQARSGVHLVGGAMPPTGVPEAPGKAGWVYNYETGQIIVNSTATDSTGRSYAAY